MKKATNSIAPLIEPRSVAVIGASDDPKRIGGRPIAYLQQAGYRGAIYPVNPTRDTVQGLACYPSIAAVPGEVDCALIALPAEKVLKAARECAARGVKSAMVFSSGFAELGAAGIAQQAELTRLAGETGMRIIGPNIVGAYNAAHGAFLTFSGAVAPSIGRPHSQVSIVSQSGGYAGYILALADERDLTFGKWITTGNEADIDLSEVLEFLADDPDTAVILAYIEGVKRGDRFMAALAKAQAAGKPTVLLKVGRTERGAEAAASHTASLAGSDAVFDAVCRQFGACRANSAEEMLDIACAARLGRFPAGNRLGVITVSGGIGVQIADLADDHGLVLPQVPEDAQRRLTEIVPFASPRNPVDITAQFTNDPTIINRSLDVMFETDRYDAIFLFIGHAAAFPALADRFVEAVEEARRKFPDRVLVLCALGPREIIARYEAAGCLVFTSPGPAVAALAALRRFASLKAEKHTAAHVFHQPTGELRALNEYEAKALLRRFGVASPDERLVRSSAEAANAGDELGYPVALKIASPDILHKSEVGGVALNLADRGALAAAADAMLRDIPKRIPSAWIDGLIVGQMISGGVECIVGLLRDPVFGPVVMFGLGGIAVEIMRDVSFRVGRIDEAEALAMIRETRSFPLLDGFRGRSKCDVAALAAILSRLSEALADGAIGSAEINPLLVLEEGKGAVALDAVVDVNGSPG